MIDIGMTNLNNQQPGVAERPQPVQPLEPVKPTPPVQTQSEQKQGSGQEGVARSLDVNRFVSKDDTKLNFRIDKDYDRLVVSILDENDEVIRQIPSELMLKIAARIEEIQEKGQLGLNERV